MHIKEHKGEKQHKMNGFLIDALFKWFLNYEYGLQVLWIQEQAQESAQSPEEYMTVGRSHDSLIPNGSCVPLGKQSPDWSHDQVQLQVQT